MSNTQYDNLCGEHFASTEREIIRIDGLNKAFGEIKAVRDLSFRVCRGELFAFLGVNGAGKSTTISIISGSSDGRRQRHDFGHGCGAGF